MMLQIFKGVSFLIFLLVLFCSVAQAKTTVEFTPGNAQRVILTSIDNATESIFVAAYAFTSKPISEALLRAHKRGVQVAVIADLKSNEKYTAPTFLANNGVLVRRNGNYAIFHHKFMVFDRYKVQTGSFNYSASAAKKNAENVVLFEDIEVAKAFLSEWLRLWEESQ